MKWIYFIFIVIVLMVWHFVTEWDSMTYGITELFSPELEGFPTSRTNLDRIEKILDKEGIDTTRFTLIDFGCGKGDVLNRFSDNFKRVIGVELNKKLARAARKTNKDNSNVRVYNTDMTKYRFKTRPTILYAYEPLWQLDTDIANEIYDKTISNLTKIGDTDVYILYLSGLARADLDPKFFEGRPFEVVRKEKLGLFPYRDLYIYRYAPDSESEQ